MSSQSDSTLRIWVDGDACPTAVKEVLIRTSRRLQLELVFVANRTIRVPGSDLIQVVTVADGADNADYKILELMNAGDVVITADIPLAAGVVKNLGVAIGPRGELFDEHNVQGKLASRNLMEHLRSAGMQTSGPNSYSQKDIQNFANQLDRTVTRCLKKNRTSNNQ